MIVWHPLKLLQVLTSWPPHRRVSSTTAVGMFSQKEAPSKPEKASSAPPRDALAALMEGNTPNKKDLKFADERPDSFDYPRGQETGHKQAKAGGRFEEYNGDHTWDHRPNQAQGEYDYSPQQTGTLNSELLPEDPQERA